MKNENENQDLEMKEKDIIAILKGERTKPTDTVYITFDKKKIPVVVRALSKKELELAEKHATHGKKQILDNAEYDANTVITATTNFKWADAKPENVSTTAQFLLNKLFAGEMSKLVSKILELSGYGDEEKETEEIKNSSEAEE